MKKQRCKCSCHELQRLGWPVAGIKNHKCCPAVIEIVAPVDNRPLDTERPKE